MTLLNYKSFLNESQKSDITFEPKDIVDSVTGLAKRVVTKPGRGVFEIWVYLEDRDSQIPKIDKFLEDSGISITKVTRAVSKGAQCTEFFLDKTLIRIVFKPTGGTAAATMNSTITELIPVLLWKSKYSGPADPDTMLEACKSVDLNSVTWASAADKKAAADYLDLFAESTAFKDKMNNAYGIYTLLIQDSIKDMIWCYRTKPLDIPRNSRADLAIVPDKGEPFGVSLKAKASNSAKVRKMSSTLPELCRFIDIKHLDIIKNWGWENVYKPILTEYISENPEQEKLLSTITANNYWDPGKTSKEKSLLIDVITIMSKKDPKRMDQIGYYKLQEYVKNYICDIVKTDTDTFIEFLKDKIGIGSSFPVKVIVAQGSSAKELHEETEDSLAATFTQTPVIATTNPNSIKAFMVSFGDTKFTYSVMNTQGGVKTANFYNFVIEQIG